MLAPVEELSEVGGFSSRECFAENLDCKLKVDESPSEESFTDEAKIDGLVT